MYVRLASTRVQSCVVAIAMSGGCGVVAASADEIAITGGSLEAKGAIGSGPIVLEGDRGFTFRGWAFTGNYQPGICSECVAGNRVSLFASWSGSDLFGVATLDGLTYPRVGDNFDNSDTSASMVVAFDGSFQLPAGSSPITLVAPFIFKAAFYHREDQTCWPAAARQRSS